MVSVLCGSQSISLDLKIGWQASKLEGAPRLCPRPPAQGLQAYATASVEFYINSRDPVRVLVFVQPGMVAHTYNPSAWEDAGEGFP